MALPSTFAALFPVGDRSVKVRTINPHSPETWRPNSRQVPWGYEIAKRPGADTAIDFCGLEIEQASGRSRWVPAADWSFGARLAVRLIDVFADW